MASARLKNLASSLPEKPRGISTGSLLAVKGPLIRASLPTVGIGDICEIHSSTNRTIQAEVIGFDQHGSYLAPYDDVRGVSPGDSITQTGKVASFQYPNEPSNCIILDGSGNRFEPLNVRNDIKDIRLSIYRKPPSALLRKPIQRKLITGVHAIDLTAPLAYGQRIGLFAGPGIGKSTLLGLIARSAKVDRVVIALVGERGREVREFIEDTLGEEGKKRSTIVVATSDESPIKRKVATYTATRIAEHHRDRGEDVLLLVDSITRAARSIRDLSLSAGEFPVRQGYTSSVFEELPKLLERAGCGEKGSITAIYTVLSSKNDSMDILADELKSLLDGHIILNEELAQQGIYPAIDITRSISRLQTKVSSDDEILQAQRLRHVRSRLTNDKGVLLLGGKADPELQMFIDHEDEFNNLFRQDLEKNSNSQSLKEEVERFLYNKIIPNDPTITRGD